MMISKVRGGLLCLAVVGLASGYLLHRGPDGKAAAATPAHGNGQAVPVTTGKVVAKDVPNYLRGLGQVQAYNTVLIKSRVDGQIVGVDFAEGQEVTSGASLFQIDPRPFQATLEQAQAAKEKDQATLASAQLDLDRFSKLLTTGYQSRQSYDQQKALVLADQAAVKQDQATIDSAQLNLVYANIRSPITGRTGARQVDIGNLVQETTGTTLVSVTQMKPIFVTFTLPQENLDEIRQYQAKAPLTVLAYAEDDKTVLATGHLTLINNQVDDTTGTIQLKASFDNADERLWPGAFISAHLELYIRKDALTVPAEAVMQSPTGAYVYLVKPDKTVARTNVAVTTIQDNMAVIASGVSAGDRVVVEGQYRLTDGSHITSEKSGTKPAAAGNAS
jgi:multidrug efflux system membrane fusion protein